MGTTSEVWLWGLIVKKFWSDFVLVPAIFLWGVSKDLVEMSEVPEMCERVSESV